jgi:hypothetical protein
VNILKTTAVAAAVVLSLTTFAPAQVILSNSKVTYTYVESPSGSFVPAAPLTSATPESSLSFAPGSFVASTSGGGFQSDNATGVLTVDMDAAPGLWFSGNALSLFLSGSYSVTAPFASSQAFTSFSSSYTLIVDGVDWNPYSSSMPLSANISITPPSVSAVGPGGSSSGLWSGSFALDINTIKAHFGIGATNNVTAMRLQLSSTVSAASIDGMASAALLNANIGNVTVPEPSTYALLALAAGWLGVVALRRKKRAAVN